MFGGRNYLTEPALRLTYNSTAPHGGSERGWWMLLAEETWIDAGGEPPAGYWQPELDREIRSRRLRALMFGPWRRGRREVSHRLRHAGCALRGDRCEYDS